MVHSGAYAQPKDLRSAEAYFVNTYTALSKQTAHDSVARHSAKFSTEFRKFIDVHPTTLTYPFTTLIRQGIRYIITSDDGKFRVYSWDQLTGGTMHFFDQLYQFRAGGNVLTKSWLDKREECRAFLL